mmetsp:Transcript_37114/g.59602  ORF Transcript_37114/g.59602 Transcript_37114/m.59602 type:complete len:511 (-) Transcript_37114:157-1689(-)
MKVGSQILPLVAAICLAVLLLWDTNQSAAEPVRIIEGSLDYYSAPSTPSPPEQNVHEEEKRRSKDVGEGKAPLQKATSDSLRSEFNKTSSEKPARECSQWNCSCQDLSNLHNVWHGRSYGTASEAMRVWWRKNQCHTSPEKRPPAKIDCSKWNCTCQGLSEYYYVSHFARSYGHATPEARTWWGINKCNTAPKPELRRPEHKHIDEKDLAKNITCFFSPTKLGNGRYEPVKTTWAKSVEGRFFFIVSEEGDTTNYIDFDKNEIHVAYKGYRDSSGKHIKGYDPEFVGRYGKIAVKMMKFWEYLSDTYDSVWASRCTYFVRTDDDTWMNTRLVEQRFSCLDPEWELSAGFSNRVWGIGIFSGYTRKWVRNFGYFIRTMRARAGDVWMHSDVDDRRLGQIVRTFGIGTIKLVAHNMSDYITNVDGHTTDSRLIQKQYEFAENLDEDFIGCMSFFHSARPKTMHILSRKLDAHLSKHGNVACPSKWKTRGMHFALRKMIDVRCPAALPPGSKL